MVPILHNNIQNEFLTLWMAAYSYIPHNTKVARIADY
jgi:hypothetical protein